MKISDVMTRDPVYASPDSSVVEIASLMNEHRLHAIPVVNNRNKVIGIVTESDFFIKGTSNMYLPSVIDMIKGNVLAEEISEDKKKKIDKILEAKVGEIMSSPCITLSYDSPIEDFFNLIKEKKLHSVPVIDSQHSLVGIITLADVISLINISKS